MPAGRLIPAIHITEDERKTLERWSHRRKMAQSLAFRARLILACAEGKKNDDVATAFHITRSTVGKWRTRFIESRLNGLQDKPRPGAPRKITDADIERVISKTHKSTLEVSMNWSTRSLAKECGLSQSTVSRRWKTFAMQPPHPEPFKL
jgi:transposase